MQLIGFPFTKDLCDIENITVQARKDSPFHAQYTLIHYYQRRSELSEAITFYKNLVVEEDFLLERATAITELIHKRDLCQRCIYDIRDIEARRPPEPIFVARFDNQLEMDILKKVFGRESLQEAFSDGGKGMDSILEKLAQEKANP